MREYSKADFDRAMREGTQLPELPRRPMLEIIRTERANGLDPVQISTTLYEAGYDWADTIAELLKRDQAVAEERRDSEVMRAIERRWSEVCAHLDAHLSPDGHRYPESTIDNMIGELHSLWVVTQYAGSNARTGWQMALDQYKQLTGRGNQ